MKTDAFFIPAGAAGQRHCVYHPAQGDALRGLVLHVHAFGEEMNKSRRMAALQSHALAGAGYGVLRIDLLGCGDSSGDFGDATWASWVDDVARACHWLRRQGSAPLWLWGLRAGCLLAADAARQIDLPYHLLFWQPVTSGKVALQQFLRLKVAAGMLTGPANGVMEDVRRQLACGNAVEVAGYTLTAALASGLEHAGLQPPAIAEPGGRVEWLEVSGRTERSLAPGSLPVLAAWREAGYAARGQVVAGPAFWHSTEIEEAPELLAATLAALAETVAA